MRKLGTKHVPGREAGSALILVIWALLLLSMAVLAWAQWVQRDIEVAAQSSQQSEAMAMARSGVTMALNRQVNRTSPQLQRELGSQLGYSVRIEGEGGRLNLNWLLAGEDPRRLALLKRWLEQMGLDFQEREVLVDCLLDYMDPDDTKRLNGAEDLQGYHPANRALQSIDELQEVYASEALTSKPGWREALTLYSSGPVDVMSASPEILRCLPGLGDAVISRFVTFRNGKDGILGTPDDPVFKNMREVQSMLGLSDAQFKELSPLITVKDPVVRIVSEGHSGKVIRQVSVVARKSGAKNSGILFWKE